MTMKIINQCLYNCCDQQLIYTYRHYYNIKTYAAYHPSLPTQSFIATVLQVIAFHATLLQLRGRQ